MKRQYFTIEDYAEFMADNGAGSLFQDYLEGIDATVSYLVAREYEEYMAGNEDYTYDGIGYYWNPK